MKLFILRWARFDCSSLLWFFYIVFIQVQSDQEAALFSPQCSTMVALAKGCKSAKVVRDQTEIPDGCGSAVVTPTILVHTLVRVSNTLIIPLSRIFF